MARFGLKDLWQLLKGAANKFGKDNPIMLAGTLAFFTIIAIPPIIIIIISVIGYFIGEQAISHEIYRELQYLIGEEGAKFIQEIVRSYESSEKENIWGTIFGVIVFLLASSTFFVIIQNSLNHVWHVKPKPKYGMLKVLKDRLISFGMILSLGFFMLVSLLLDSILAFFGNYLKDIMPNLTVAMVYVGEYIISFGLTTLVFASMFKFLPDAKVEWRVVWVGALTTAILFTLGKVLIGLGLGNSDISNMYGAAGSVIIILLWVFYSSLIIFFGAEVTQQYAEKYERYIEPKKYAVKVETREVEQP